jgi:peptide/nickel transport system permease protein
MARYVISRLLQGLVILWGVTLVVFMLIHLIPGDPGRLVLGYKASAFAVRRLDHQLGLDRSLAWQYLHYLEGLVHGDLGTSISDHVSVTSVIGSHIAPSVLLVTYAIVIALAVSTPLALIAALRNNRGADHAIRVGSVVAYAMPPFWIGLLLALLLGLKWGVLPTSGYDGGGPGSVLRTLTLPAITVALYTAPALLRTLRSSVIANLGEDYVDASRARGLSERRILVKHVLRNSLTSTVTLVGVSVGTLLSLAVIVEQVFAIPGLGSLLVASVIARDYPTVQGVTLVFAVAVVLANLMADLLYVVIDPRVRL